jgi:hypothetical protein
MKKISLMILTLLIGFCSISYANDNDKVTRAILLSFQQDFKDATQVSWSETSSCFKATFMLEGQTTYAYYDKKDASLIAITRNILSNQLPLNLQQQLRSKMKEGWLANLFEVASGGETYYYATVESDENTSVYKSSGFSDWSLASKTDK